MKFSGPEINSKLREKLEQSTGRHLYVVLGSYEQLVRYERVSLPEARGPSGEKLPEPINLNRALLERIPDSNLKSLVQNEARRPKSICQRIAKELESVISESLENHALLILKQVELLFTYDLELNPFRIRAVNQKHILLLLPGERTSQRISRVLKSHWNVQAGKKAIILIFDGLRTDAWKELVQPVLEEKYDVIDELPGSAIIPTETHLSRKAISAGCLPVEFSSTTERVLLEYALKKHLGLEVKFKAEKEADDVEAGIAARFISDKMDVVIFGFTDKNLHYSQQDLAFIYTANVREILRQDVRSVLREMPDDANVFVVSDHGFCPVNEDTFTIPRSVVMDPKDVKYRVGRLKYPLEGEDTKQAVTFKVEDLGIPDQVPAGRWKCKHVAFPRPGLTLKRPQGRHTPETYTHGGLSMAECLIPMVVLGPKVEFRPPFQLVGLEIRGTPVEGESLEVVIVITAKAEQPVQQEIIFQLKASVDEILPRKEVFVGTEATYQIRWRPKTEEATPEEQSQGKMIRPVTVIASYQWQDRPVRTSCEGQVEVKLDTSRIRRRLDSRLDSIMGMVPKGLR